MLLEHAPARTRAEATRARRIRTVQQRWPRKKSTLDTVGLRTAQARQRPESKVCTQPPPWAPDGRKCARNRVQRLPVKSLPALHAEAVAAKVVMPAVGAYQPPRRVCLQPALVLPPVPHSVLRTEHPAMPLAVQHREVTHCEPEGTRLERAGPALRHQRLVVGLCFGEGIDGHVETVSPAGRRGVRQGPV